MAECSNPLMDYDAGYYEYIPGLWLPGKLLNKDSFGTISRRAVDDVIGMELHDTDILCATYPKSGQTWLMTMIHLIQNAAQLEETNDYDVSAIYINMPFLELEMSDGQTGVDLAKKLPAPRVFKCHLLYQLWKEKLEKNPKVRVIQTTRNPKDTLVSYYHHYRSDGMLGGFNGTWDQFFDMVKAKRLSWGDLFEHTAAWYEFNKNRPNSLVVKYEDMKKDHKGHVKKIADFIGCPLSEKAIDLVVEKSTVKVMLPKYKVMDDEDPTWNTERSTFIRKGVVGDWKNYFSKEQSDYVDQRSKECLEPVGLKYEYEL